MTLLGETPEGRGHRVAEAFAQFPDQIQAWSRRFKFGAKATAKKKKLTCGVVGLGLHDFMAGRRKCLLGVAKHHACMPWN